MFQPTTDFLKDTLDALTGVGGTLAGVFVGLYALGTELTPNSPLSAVNEAVFDGYARLPVTTWLTAFLRDGKPTCQGSGTTFRPTGSSSSTLCGGYFLTDVLSGTAGNLLGWEPFAVPRNMGTPADVTIIDSVLSFDQLANYGAGIVE